MSVKRQIVTIDGPSGVGKSSVSRIVAAELGYTYLDTGAMYRGVGHYFHNRDINIEDETRISSMLSGIHLELVPASSVDDDVGVLLNGEDVSEQIRTPEMSMVASKISALSSVRSFLTTMQRSIAERGKIVAEGRDMGTVVFPEARYKFFLEASPEERCRRRVRQLQQKGIAADAEEILEMIVKRDKDDSERAVAPLKKAEDAHALDTTSLSLEEVCEAILEAIGKTTR
jgi:cytidylate kinase